MRSPTGNGTRGVGGDEGVMGAGGDEGVMGATSPSSLYKGNAENP
jgi:hypothetical protein